MSTEPDTSGLAFTNPLSNARLEFYLRNRTLIDQWAAVRKDVTAATDELIEGLGSELAALATSAGADVSFARAGQDTNWPRFMLFRQTWPGGHLVEPEVGVTLEWQTRQVDPGNENAPYVGIRITNPAGTGTDLRVRLARVKRSGDLHYSNMWPAFRRLVAAEKGDWWKDVPGWRDEMIAHMELAWVELSPLIDAALAAKVQI
jgi:hypothetical protein